MQLISMNKRILPKLSFAMRVACLLAIFTANSSLITISFAQSPVAAEPVVARVEMKLSIKGEVIDVIEKGDLLTVLEDREDKYLIQTHNGTKGVVAKVNAVQIAESVKIYSDLINEAPDEGRLYTLRASAYFALGDQDRALRDFDKAIEKGYMVPHAYSSRGLFQSAIGNLEAAIKDHTLAITQQDKQKSEGEIDALDAGPYINRAAVYLSQGKFDSAIADYTRSIEIRPNDPVLLQQRAIAFKQSGDLSAAIKDFTSTIQQEPNAIPALLGRGFIHFQLSDHEKAVADFTKVIEINPDAAVAYNNRGYNYQQMDKYNAALADYRKAVELAPKYALALQNMAWLLAVVDDAEIRDPQAAVEAAQMACKLSDYKNVSDIAALAAALAASGDFEKAVGWQEKVVEQADVTQKEYTTKILERYKSDQPFDPNLIETLGVMGKDN